MAYLKRSWLAAAGLLAGGLFSTPQLAQAQYHAAYAVENEPPALQQEVVESRPGYLWIKGHWEWRHGHWDWSPGYWEPVQERRIWVEGRWEKHGHHWQWYEGHWEEAPNAVPAPAPAPAPTYIEVENEPPVDPGEAMPAPRPGFVWITGHWWWRGRWEWVPGRWEAERPGFVWAPGRWEKHEKHHRWVEGHWEQHR
jgi:hypothetical protein